MSEPLPAPDHEADESPEARELRERLEAVERENQTLREELENIAEQMQALLFALLEIGVPGSIDRGLRNAELARRLSERFGIPDELLGDLELAARLHELGKLVARTERSAVGGPREIDAWRYVQGTVVILERVGGYQGVVELIHSMYENWDGTGHPEHWQSGQIPLRCRILRVLVDFFAALERPGPVDVPAVLDAFQERAGTLYDPMVVVHLRALLQQDAKHDVLGSTLLVAIPELEEGMVLAEDLYTDSGLKLLARDTTLTHATLEVIRRRHRAEPIVHGAAVRRRR